MSERVFSVDAGDDHRRPELMPLIEREVLELRHEVNALKTQLDTMSNDVKGLLVAWETTGGVVSFVKFVAALIVSVTIIWAFFKDKVGV